MRGIAGGGPRFGGGGGGGDGGGVEVDGGGFDFDLGVPVGGVDAPSAIASRSLATSASAVRAPVYSVGIARLLRPKILIVG